MTLVFDYTDYRAFLKDFFTEPRKDGRRSFRAVAKKAGFKSPNYLQKIIHAEKNLSLASASSLSRVLGISPTEQKYFVKLVQLQKAESTDAKLKCLADMTQIIAKKERKSLKDATIYTLWPNLILLEVAHIPNFEMSLDNLHAKLRGHASREELQESLNFLISKGLLLKTDGTEHYKAQPVDFVAVNDGIRYLEVQKSHLRFLDIAKHRTHDSFSQRCFQALTVAAPQEKMAYVRQRICDFLDELNEELTESGTPETVFQIQCQAFKLI